MMFDRILIPLDGSPRAERVLSHLASVLVRKDSEVLLVRSVSVYPLMLTSVDAGSYLARAKKAAEEYLQGVAKTLEERGVRVRTQLLEGYPAEAILDVARRERSSMIAMTTHGRSGLARWLLGSVAEKILRASPVPVLAVRSFGPTARGTSEPTAPKETVFHRILVATDGSPASRAMEEPVEELAKLFGSQVVVLHVWDTYVPEGDPLPGMEAGMTLPTSAPSSLEDEVTAEVAGRLSRSGLQVTRVTAQGEPAAQIIEQSQAEGIDLVVLGTHGRSGLSRWMLGSVAERVLRSLAVPLLVVRAGAPTDGGNSGRAPLRGAGSSTAGSLEKRISSS